ncbi:MAG: hypothetical protein HQK52_14290 [Oligoflexia bacterium]|nr:hypothetical protein [Oligoflexia bacterium]
MILNLFFISLLGTVTYIVMNYHKLIIKTSKLSEENITAHLEFQSATETVYLAYIQAKVKYLTQLSSCTNTVKPFLEALNTGHGCDQDIAVQIFTSGDEVEYPNAMAIMEKFYYYDSGCTIHKDKSDCMSQSNKMITINKSNYKEGYLTPIHDYRYDFYILQSLPDKGQLEFLVILTRDKSDTIFAETKKRFFSLDDSMETSDGNMETSGSGMAHMDADGKVVNSAPSPLDRCGGKPWGKLLLFDPLTSTCNSFSMLGGVDGLAYYKGRYFGFRPSDGQVFDLLSTFAPGKITLEEDGTLDGTGALKIFPSYSKALLSHSQDITLIEDDIYTISSNGVIGLMDLTADDGTGNKGAIISICDLAKLGWMQNYDGILALAKSSKLGDISKVGNIATFYLKTSNGDLLNVNVEIISDTGNGHYSCTVTKDKTTQEIEFKRSYGFDRV